MRRPYGSILRIATGAFVGVLLATHASGLAQPTNLQQSIVLKDADDSNTRLELSVRPGTSVVPLAFRVGVPGPAPVPAWFAVTPFEAVGGTAIPTARATLRYSGKTAEAEAERVAVELVPGWVDLSLALKELRPRTTYKGRLRLLGKDDTHAWEITIKATDFGILAVGKLPPIKVALDPIWKGEPFAMQLWDKSGDGPYTNVRVRLEDANQGKTQGLGSAFTARSLSFWDCTPKTGDGKPVQAVAQVDLGCTPLVGTSSAIRVDRGGQAEILARVESLGPGEYTPTLRFTGDSASDQAEESKLTLTLQVRHSIWMAVVVIIIGSVLGWIGNKYAGGYWSLRTLRREAELLAAMAAALARPDPRAGGWRFPGEANSYALVWIRVTLHQVRYLTKSVLRVLAGEQEIRDRLADARRRVLTLELFRTARLKLQAVASDRPAAQVAIGRALRQVRDILDQPSFGDAEKAKVEELLKNLDGWLTPERWEALYREAVLGRIRDLQARAEPKGVPDQEARDQLETLLRKLSEVPNLADQPVSSLLSADRTAEQLNLLWRDWSKPWGPGLVAAETTGQTLEARYQLADKGVWEQITVAAGSNRLQIVVAADGEATLRTYDLVDMTLKIQSGDGLAESDVIRLPCKVRWRVTGPSGQSRVILTDGLTLVHYFQSSGRYRVKAGIEWQGRTIDFPDESEVVVEENPEFGLCATFEWMEFAVTGLAAVFAILTGIGTQYDATFGSFSQYTALFFWASGASAGGNLFTQRGTGRTVAGQEAQVPGR